jgi:uncharacterized Ntn-hydrolase superfamily protein
MNMEQPQAPAGDLVQLTDTRSVEVVAADPRLCTNDVVPMMVKLDEVIAAVLSSGDAKGGVKRKLKSAEHTVKKKKQRNTQSTALAICDANLQRLHALKAHFNELYNPLARVFTQYHRDLTASQVRTSSDVAEGDVKREKQQPRLKEDGVIRKGVSKLPVEVPDVLRLFHNF